MRNLALFVPLGASLRRSGVGFGLSVAFAAVVSGGIELAQLWIPGRHSSLGDFAINGAGAALGATWVGSNPFARACRHRELCVLASTLGALLPAWARQPAYPRGVLFAHQPPRIEGLRLLPGAVVSTRIAGVTLPTGPLEGEASGRLVDDLERGRAIAMELRLDAAISQAWTGIFMLTREDRVELLRWTAGPGLNRVGYHSLGEAAGFEPAFVDLAAPDWWMSPGEVSARVELGGEEICAMVEGIGRCVPRATAADGWRTLVPRVLAEHPRGGPMLAIGDAVWLAMLATPVGRSLAGRGRFRLSGSGLWLATVAIAPLGIHGFSVPGPAPALAAAVGAAVAWHGARRR